MAEIDIQRFQLLQLLETNLIKIKIFSKEKAKFQNKCNFYIFKL